jgi:hypothetical protein
MLSRLSFLWLILFLMLSPSFAQESPITATTYRQTFVHEGPNITYIETDVLNPGIPVEVVQRNNLGSWVRVQRSDNGNLVLDGWILSAFLNSTPELQYGDLPISDLADAAPENVLSQTLAELYTQPLIPSISPAMLEVYAQGQELGNHANVITKVGDSLSASDQYINIFEAEGYNLGAYSYLEPSLLFYRDGTDRESIAAQIGMSTYVVFDPLWATDEDCEANESPLACEYRLTKPSVAFILFGPNDVRSMTETEYHEQMRLIVEETMETGIIPVLFTFSAHPDDNLYWQAMNFNLELINLVAEYEIPLINLWAASQALPDFGLDDDHVHLTHSGFDVLKYDSGHESFYGTSLQNLLVLRTLYEIQETLGENE